MSSDQLKQIFAAAKAEERGVLAVYFACGDPDPETTVELAVAAIDAGADIIELGVPFSDPVADGPTIQAASERALQAGMSIAKVFDVASQVSAARPDAGLVLMGYANPFFRYGIERSARRSAASGVGGWIIPDVPYEESARFREYLDPNGVAFVPLLAPTTPVARAHQILAGLDTPFAYFVSLTGVTGARKGLPDNWHEALDEFRVDGGVPFVVGFGISSGEIAAEAFGHADGVVVGSAVIDRAVGSDPEHRVESVKELVAEIRAAI